MPDGLVSGTVHGDRIHLHRRHDLRSRPSDRRRGGGRRRDVADADRADQDGGAVEQLPGRRGKERLGDPGRAAHLPEGAEHLCRTRPADPGAEILAIGRVAYEGELGIVIGETCSGVAPEEAAGHILGFTCVNDVTAHGVAAA